MSVALHILLYIETERYLRPGTRANTIIAFIPTTVGNCRQFPSLQYIFSFFDECLKICFRADIGIVNFNTQLSATIITIQIQKCPGHSVFPHSTAEKIYFIFSLSLSKILYNNTSVDKNGFLSSIETYSQISLRWNARRRFTYDELLSTISAVVYYTGVEQFYFILSSAVQRLVFFRRLLHARIHVCVCVCV